ncbi:hypothetical protein JA1_005130 [Spathaspora sp. JA1]|nr:hypothetical protein JA1_005130 [Spathaspora sp. JA1]
MQLETISNDTVIPIDEFQIDYSELLQQDSQDIEMNRETNNNTSSYSMRISLPPDTSHHNQITNELFQITNRESWTSTLKSRTSTKQPFNPHEFLFGSSALNNDKVHKMMSHINYEKQKQLEQDDYELDDVVRVGFYRGNIGGSRQQFNVENNEIIDSHLENYLRPSFNRNDENKENQDLYPEPLKVKKTGSNSINKPSIYKSTKGIPILKPIHSNTAKAKKFEAFILRNNVLGKSPKRICSPNNGIVPGKSLLKNHGPAFLIESSSGLINEATKFGTELNSSNCQGFPFPETETEIVQIPTNEDDANKKMAIIRMINNKPTANPSKKTQIYERSGFYNESEFQEYKDKNHNSVPNDHSEGVKVVSQNIDNIQQTSSSSKTIVHKDIYRKQQPTTKTVKWAPNLEW